MESPQATNMRQISEDRIKRLELTQCWTFQAHVANEDKFIRDHMIERMGQEIAQKLYEFNKVIIQHDGGSHMHRAIIEVIVPTTPTENE